jgi:hypothetical protein
MIARNSVRISALVATLVFAAACDNSSPTSPNVLKPQATNAITLPAGAVAGEVWVCKDAPSGTFDFTVSTSGGTVLDATPEIAAGTCTKVATPAGLSGLSVTVTELAETGFLFDHIDAYTIAAGTNVVTQEGTPVATASITRSFGDVGRIFVFVNVLEPSTNGCTLTQGFWKNHPSDWPVTSLTLGTVNYTQQQLLQILKQPVKGNGLVALAHQLIAAKLNVAEGATSSTINATIAAADALIGALIVPPVGSGYLSTSSVATLVGDLTAFNEGNAGPSHCGADLPL